MVTKRIEGKSLRNALLQEGLVTSSQLADIEKEQRETDQPLRVILTKKGLLTEEAIAHALSNHLNIPYIQLDHYYIDPNVVQKVPKELALRHLLIPLFQLDESITIAIADPFDVFGIDAVEQVTNCKINLVAAAAKEITSAIEANYKMTDKMTEILDDLSVEAERTEIEVKSEAERLMGVIEENPVVKLVNMLINQAISERASDIHIEPTVKNVRVRYRIDGVLQEALIIPKHLQSAVTSRWKVLAGMNIAEKRLPQDGHVEIKHTAPQDSRSGAKELDLDMRVATYPIVWGEKIVVRLLNRTAITFGLKELGFGEEPLKKFQWSVRQPHGLILTTGPTGSGKTTTLYAALNTINTIERNIVTIEDPVEYRLPLVNQSQVNAIGGITFSSGLRSILRQDPDIIMVGEIRDLETAQLAIHAALTGHLVLSSLHTNDAASSATRLIDMGIEPYLVASTLICAIGQRLVRLLCPRCKEVYNVTSEEKTYFALHPNKDFTFYKNNGCINCEKIGYSGRTGIFELMTLDDDIRRAIVTKQPSSVIRQAAVKQGMITLRHAVLEKVQAGLTSMSEAMRVTMDEEAAMMLL